MMTEKRCRICYRLLERKRYPSAKNTAALNRARNGTGVECHERESGGGTTQNAMPAIRLLGSGRLSHGREQYRLKRLAAGKTVTPRAPHSGPARRQSIAFMAAIRMADVSGTHRWAARAVGGFLQRIKKKWSNRFISHRHPATPITRTRISGRV